MEPAFALYHDPDSGNIEGVHGVDDPLVHMVVKEMEVFRPEFNSVIATNRSEDHDLASFWLRKSQKPVLSVLLVQKGPLGVPKLYRG